MIKKGLFLGLMSSILLATTLQNNLKAQQIAFPTAEGMGKFTTGGRGTASTPTTVYEVTNLNDDGSVGTLRYAVNATTTYRTIVFRVSGTIHLTSKLNIKANTTIAGQTAPGDGICLADYPVVISGDNVILRYIRCRMGDKNQLKTTPAGCGVPVAPFTAACMPLDGSGGDDALGNLGNKNIIIDHCSVSWSNDEALTVYRGDSVTMQWNFIEEPLNYSYHFETGDADFENHGYGGIWGAQNATFHHNLIAHCRNRNPRFAGNSTYPSGAIEKADFRNNVLYNWGINTIYGGDGGNYNLVNNYYKYGPSTSFGVRYRIVGIDSSATYGWAKYYLNGNYVDGSTANTNNNWVGVYMMSGNLADTFRSKSSTPFNFFSINTETATNAFTSVLNSAGCKLPKRDTLDTRVVNNVLNRTGRIIDCQGGYPHATPYANTVNAWPTLTSLTAPIDTDKDGMPDNWETVRGLNYLNATDRYAVNANGYTNLENYLNGDSIVATNTNNTCVTSKIKNLSATNNWLHLADTTSSIINAMDTTTLIASVKDVVATGTITASYYTTSTTRTFNSKVYLNRNITINNTSTASTIRMYFTTAEFNALKTADASITALSDLKVYRSINTNCLTQIDAIAETITPTATGSFGTYANGYFIEFTSNASGSYFIAGANLVTAIAPINTDKKLKVYPNPAKNNLYIQSDYDNKLTLQIIDVYGKVVVEKTNIIKGTNTINIANLPSALYCLKIINNKKILTSKMVKL